MPRLSSTLFGVLHARTTITGWLLPLGTALCVAALAMLGLGGDRLVVSAILVFCVACWATGWLPDFLVSLLLLTLLAAGTRLEPAVTFSGFASGAFWLVFAGAVLGMALSTTGLGNRAAGWMVGRCGRSYAAALAGVVTLSFLLSVVMPSTLGRIAILVPVVLGFADQVGLRVGRPGRTGLVLAAALASCELSSALLPANLPNLVMAGTAEAGFGLRLSYGEYAMLLLPALALARGIVLVAACLLLFRDRVDDTATPAPSRPFTVAEAKLLTILALLLLLWTTERWHGIAPGWVGLIGALLCLGPARLVETDAFLRSVKLQPLWFVAAIIGMTAAVDRVGLVEELHPLVAKLGLGSLPPFLVYAVLVGFSVILTFAVTSNAAPALYTPLAPQLAAAAGWAVKPVLLAQVVGFSTIVLPYQAPPLVVAMALAGIGRRDAARYCLGTAALSLVTIIPLNFIWWWILGAV